MQRVIPYETEVRELTGELGAMEGEPIRAVLWDRSGVIEERDGIAYVDARKTYVLQARSLDWMVGSFWIGATGMIALSAIISRQRAGKAASSSSS